MPYSVPNQRSSHISLPALELIFSIEHRISLDHLGLLIWKYFLGVFSQLADLFPGFIRELRTKRGGQGMAPEILASIPVL